MTADVTRLTTSLAERYGAQQSEANIWLVKRAAASPER
jgi:hypothetical protein